MNVNESPSRLRTVPHASRGVLNVTCVSLTLEAPHDGSFKWSRPGFNFSDVILARCFLEILMCIECGRQTMANPSTGAGDGKY